MCSQRQLRYPIPMMKHCDYIPHVNVHATLGMKWTSLRKSSVQPGGEGQMGAEVWLRVPLQDTKEEGLLLEVGKLSSLMISG